LIIWLVMKDLFSNLPFVIGVVASVIHVFTGPDHLAAIGPLALNAKFRPWLIGVFWGTGHVIGMSVIGVLFFFFRDILPVEVISSHSEQLVGLMLIFIGLWAFFRIYRVSHEKSGNNDNAYKKPLKENHRHTLLAALGIGVLHGLAGVSHFLGLLPTLAFATVWQSAFYLIGFAVGTLLAMTLFAFIMGVIGKSTSGKLKMNIYNGINIAAGTIAVAVGAFWLIWV